MKNFLLIWLCFAFIGCGILPNKSPYERKRAAYLSKVSSYLDITRDHQLAWSRAQLNLLYWINVPGESQQKAELEKFINNDLAVMEIQVDSIGSLLGVETVKDLRGQMDTVAMGYKEIMADLANVESYNNPQTVFLVQSRVFDTDGDCVLRFKLLNEQLKVTMERLHFKLIDDGE